MNDKFGLRKNFVLFLGLAVLDLLILFIIWEFFLREPVLSSLVGENGASSSAKIVSSLAVFGISILALIGPGYLLVQSILEDFDIAQKEIESTSRRYKAIVEATNDLIFQVDSEGIILYANPAIRLLGYEKSDLIGKNIYDVLYMDDKREVIPKITTKRVGHRATFNCPVQLMTSENSVISNEIPAMEFVMDACGIWEEPDDIVQTQGTEKKFLGTLCIARPVVDRALIENL